MYQCHPRNSVRNFRGIALLLFVGFQFFPFSEISPVFGIPGPIPDEENQILSDGFLPKNFSLDSDGNIFQELPYGKIQMVGQVIPKMAAKGTSLVKMSGALNATQAASKRFSIAQLLADPFNQEFTQFSVGFQVFDSLGIGHGMTTYFSKIAINHWQYFVIANASEVNVITGNSDSRTGNALVSQGSFEFTSKGLLDSETDAKYFNSAGTGIDFINGSASAQAIAIDVGTSITTDNGNGDDGIVQQGDESLLLTLSQDGFGPGRFNGLAVFESGLIVGRYSNGQTLELGQALPLGAKHPHQKKNQQHRTHKKHGNESSEPPVLEFPNSLNAVQSGVWTVGQFGAWHVNVDSSLENPVVVKDVSVRKKEPWAYTQSFQFQHDDFSIDDVVLTVPPGNRLFIHHVSLHATTVGRVKSGKDPQLIASMNTTYNNFPMTYQFGLSDLFRIENEGHQEIRHILSKAVRLYADNSSQVQIIIDRNFKGQQQEGTISLTGYLEQVQ